MDNNKTNNFVAYEQIYNIENNLRLLILHCLSDKDNWWENIRTRNWAEIINHYLFYFEYGIFFCANH